MNSDISSSPLAALYQTTEPFPSPATTLLPSALTFTAQTGAGATARHASRPWLKKRT